MSDNVPQVEAQAAGKHNLQVALEVFREHRSYCRIAESFIHIPFLHYPRLAPNSLVRWAAQQTEEIAQRTLYLWQQDVGRAELIVCEKALETFANELKSIRGENWRSRERAKDIVGRYGLVLLNVLPSPDEQIESHFDHLAKMDPNAAFKIVFDRSRF